MRSAVRAWLCAAAAFTAATTGLNGQSASGRTDMYHVHFTKAAPGQADALGKALMMPDKTVSMPDHFVVLRHQEGDDWDYAVIQHLGANATVTAAPAPPNPARDLRAWHDDTFVSGPSWADFSRAIGIGGTGAAGMVFVVGVHRAVPGHRDQLQKALAQPTSGKVQTGDVLFEHVEGGAWQYMTITRYNSWQDLATDRVAAAGAAAAPGGWAESNPSALSLPSRHHRRSYVGKIARTLRAARQARRAAPRGSRRGPRRCLRYVSLATLKPRQKSDGAPGRQDQESWAAGSV